MTILGPLSFQRTLVLGLTATAIVLAAGAGCDAESADVIGAGPARDAGVDAMPPRIDGGYSEAGARDGSLSDTGTGDPGDDASDSGPAPLDASDADLDASDGESQEALDGAPDAPGDANAGLVLVLGSNLTLVGITSVGMVIYSDGANYSGIPLTGGSPKVIVPMAGIDHTVIAGSAFFAWSATTPMVMAAGCPACTTPFYALGGFAIPETTPIASDDGTVFAFTSAVVLGASTVRSLWALDQSGLARTLVLDSPEISFQFAPNDDLVATSEDDAGATSRRSVFAGDGGALPTTPLLTQTFATSNYVTIAPDSQWLFDAPTFRITHLPDGATTTFPETLPDGGQGFISYGGLFNAAGDSLYVYGLPESPEPASVERISLPDLGVTMLPVSSMCHDELLVLSRDGTSALCGPTWSSEGTFGILSLQTGAVTPIPGVLEILDDRTGHFAGFANAGLTDDWSFFWSTTYSEDAGALVATVTPVGGSAQVTLGSIPDSTLFAATSLSSSTLLVRNGSAVGVFDATGQSPPMLVASTVAMQPSAWALSHDRKSGAYVTPTAPAGLYTVGLPQ